MRKEKPFTGFGSRSKVSFHIRPAPVDFGHQQAADIKMLKPHNKVAMKQMTPK